MALTSPHKTLMKMFSMRIEPTVAAPNLSNKTRKETYEARDSKLEDRSEQHKITCQQQMISTTKLANPRQWNNLFS